MASWFRGYQTVGEIKGCYRDLAKQYHPDMGGDTATMQDINAAYHEALKACDGQVSHDDEGKKHTYHYKEHVEQAVMDKINELLRARLDGIDVWLIGVWVWVGGDTRPHRDALKELGFRWHSRRQHWYWRQKAGYRASNASLAALAARYGAAHFKDDDRRRELTGGS